MSKLHNKLIIDHVIVPKEGQRDLLCSNNESIRCPSLDYKCITPSEDMVNKAFDILFEEVMKLDEN